MLNHSLQALHLPLASSRMPFDSFAQINSSVWQLNGPPNKKKSAPHWCRWSVMFCTAAPVCLRNPSTLYIRSRCAEGECWMLSFFYGLSSYHPGRAIHSEVRVMHSSGRQRGRELPARSFSRPINTFLQSLLHLTLIRGTSLLADMKRPSRICAVRWAVAACSGHFREQKLSMRVWDLINRLC